MNYLKNTAAFIVTTLVLCFMTPLYAIERAEIINNTLYQVQQAVADEPEALIWLEDKEEVFKIAKEQQKLIFLLSGSHGCGICRRTMLNLDSVPDLRQIVDNNYIMWFSDFYTDEGKAETSIYTKHLIDGGAKTLPLVAVINPEDPNNYVSSFWGSQTASFIKTFLNNTIKITPNESISSQNKKVTIFENTLYVSSDSDNELINVYAITGQQIYTGQKKEQNITINASSFPKGILIVQSSKGWSFKIIKR